MGRRLGLAGCNRLCTRRWWSDADLGGLRTVRPPLRERCPAELGPRKERGPARSAAFPTWRAREDSNL